MAFTKINAAGIGSTETVTLDGLTVINDGSFGGNVSVGGTLTYEDVTNIDSVGLITARAGVVVGSGITLSKDGDIFATGITTVSGNVKVGTGITLSPDGDGFFTGVVTATSYAGDGSALTGISVDSTQIVTGNTSVQTVDTGSDGHVKVNTEGSERVRIIADGKVGVNKTAPNFHFDVAGNIGLTEGQVITWHDGSGTKAGDMYIDSSDNFILRNTSSVSERLRIDSSGRLLLGTTTEGHTNADNLTIADSDNSGITIRSGTSSYGLIYFSDATSGNAEFAGFVNYNHATNELNFGTGETHRTTIDSSGHLKPAANDTYDLGSSSLRWRDIYTGDLNLSNEGKTNDVDGTWGNYTIQEGENDLFLINNRSGKKYKFNLTEVS